MIAPLRARHRRAFTVLALALPALYLLALRARPDRPTMAATALPGAAPQTAASAASGAPPVPLFPDLEIDVRLLAAGTVLELDPRAMPRAPDVLVYWRRPERGAASGGSGGDLPDDAVLLGALAPRARRYPLPAPGGTVLLYSLGHRTVIARAALPASVGATP